VGVRDRDVVSRIAQLVRAGAALTSYTCPVCGTVLVRLGGGELYCANCDRTVIVARSEAEAQEALEVYQLRDARRAVFNKIVEVSRLIEKAPIDELDHYGRVLITLLEAYERLSRIGRQFGEGEKGRG